LYFNRVSSPKLDLNINSYIFVAFAQSGYNAKTIQIYEEIGNTVGGDFDPESAFAPNFARNKFACTATRTKSGAERPTSVHRLGPGDIEVVGAMGDSLTAANGAKANNVIGVLTEDRGVSWSIGGENSDINKLVSLPSMCICFFIESNQTHKRHLMLSIFLRHLEAV
jgi:hypothetical protein